jgi:hypothetical protein
MPPSQADVRTVATVLARAGRWDPDDAAGRARDLWVTAQMATPVGVPLAEVTDPFVLQVHRPVQPEDAPPGLPMIIHLTLRCRMYSNADCEAFDPPGAERAQPRPGPRCRPAHLPGPRLPRCDGRRDRRRRRILPGRGVLPVRHQARPAPGIAGSQDGRARGTGDRAGRWPVRGTRRRDADGRGGRPGPRRSRVGTAVDRVPGARRPRW